VWPPETFLRLKVEALAARGVRVTVAAVMPPGETSPRLRGVEIISQPHWAESPAHMVVGLMGDAFKVAVRSPRSLLGAVKAAWTADSPARPGSHPRTVPSLPSRAGERRAPASRLIAMVARLRVYLPLAHLRPDVVHFSWNSAAISYLPLARLWSCPTVVSCRGSEVNVKPNLARGREFARRLRASFRNVSAVHCVSNAIAAEAAKHGMRPSSAWVIRPAVDTAFFRLGPDAAPHRRQLRVVSVGTLRWLKGHEHAIRAIGRLAEWEVPVRLDILGEDPLRPLGEPSDRERLEHAIEQLGLHDRVHLCGFVPPSEVRRRLQEADVLLHTSLSEGIPSAVLEAMACGLPVVVTDCGGVREAVTDGVEGFVVPVRAPSDAAVALRALYEDPQLRARLGAAGRSRVESEFSLTRQVDGFAALYESMVAGEVRSALPDGVLRRRPRRAAPPDDGGAIRLLSIGPLSWTQGLDDAIHAVRLLLDRGVGCHYRIIGEGEYLDALCFARYQLDLDRQVEFLGPRKPEHWREQMQWADVFVDVPVRHSRRSALAQAGASGLRAVTTASRVTSDSTPGEVYEVPARDPNAMADAIATAAGRAVAGAHQPTA
jgi:colanic acid/amylovoran biosynthesis glycosyltransferase